MKLKQTKHFFTALYFIALKCIPYTHTILPFGIPVITKSIVNGILINITMVHIDNIAITCQTLFHFHVSGVFSALGEGFFYDKATSQSSFEIIFSYSLIPLSILP
jgi:hypothetical protein